MPPTIAQAMKDFVQSAGGQVSSEEIKRSLDTTYPNQWQPSAIQAHLYACVVNNPGAYTHHRYTEKFMFKHPDGSFEFYDETLHGPNTWDPASAVEQEGDVNEYVETSISLEKDIEDSLAQGIATIETGLRLVGRQVEIDVGRIDLADVHISNNQVWLFISVHISKPCCHVLDIERWRKADN
jgi:hypothetical protein